MDRDPAEVFLLLLAAEDRREARAAARLAVAYREAHGHYARARYDAEIQYEAAVAQHRDGLLSDDEATERIYALAVRHEATARVLAELEETWRTWRLRVRSGDPETVDWLTGRRRH